MYIVNIHILHKLWQAICILSSFGTQWAMASIEFFNLVKISGTKLNYFLLM
jgi:hypothetical protein